MGSKFARALILAPMLLALAACGGGSQGATPHEIALALNAERARGHLTAARENAEQGRWDLAAVHAAHPAESMPTVEPPLTARDAGAAASLRRALGDVVRTAQARDAAGLARAVDDADGRLARVAIAVMGDVRAAEVAFRASVMAALVDASADEYGEGVVNGALFNEVEYQDAYAYFQRALATWTAIEEPLARSAPDRHRDVVARLADLRTAMPTLRGPALPVRAERVEAAARSIGEELSAAGARPPEAAASAQELRALTAKLDDARAALAGRDVAGARSAYRQFREGWSSVEDGVRARSRDAYRQIEDGMHDVEGTLVTPETPDPARADRAIAALDGIIDSAAATLSTATPPAASTGSFATVLAHLDRALTSFESGDAPGARAAMVAFRNDWTDVESLVKARSPAAYTEIENDTASAISLLDRRPADLEGARAAVTRIRAQLAPFASSEATYGPFDAAIILLREGLEALLVVAALLAFLAKTGNADKRRWIWGGGAAGVAASLVVAVVVNVAFAAGVSSGANRELLEGITGLVAAAMLLYVGYWLHSKASLASWQRYIHEKSQAALARNSLLSLALIAFLAVFREGAETVLFYLGIAPSIALGDLALGLAIGATGLAATTVAVLVLGVRIPIRPFFLATGVLVYYLAFKFVGSGIHALQVAGYVPATTSDSLPEVGFFGMYPTLETTTVQAILLAGALAVLLIGRVRSVAPVPSQHQ